MDSIISGAEKLFLCGKYSKVLRMLEPQVFQFRDSYRFYLLLGYSCLHTGDFGGAYSYLRRAEQLSHGDIPANLGIALIHSKRGETESAIRIWLDIIERKSSSKEAHRGLRLIRESRDFAEISLRLEDGKLDRYLFYPKKKKPVSRFLIFIVLLGAALTGALLYFSPWNQENSSFLRPEIAGLDFFEKSSSSENTVGSYNFTDSELKELTEKILNLMDIYRDNLARVEINRLLLSNASPHIKEKARYLIGFIKEPDFSNIQDNFSYQQVAGEPQLYAGCYVIWTGKAANISVQKDQINFDLLVGYDSGKVLEAVVPVLLDFPVELSEGKPLEILGKVVVAPGSVSSTGISLTGKSVHQFIQ